MVNAAVNAMRPLVVQQLSCRTMGRRDCQWLRCCDRRIMIVLCALRWKASQLLCALS